MGNKKGIWQLAVKQIKKTTMLLKIEKKMALSKEEEIASLYIYTNNEN